MTFTHALSTNNYGPAKFIVSSSAANGTHTNIAAALTAASSGDTIFLRPGTYTEDISLKAGVNLAAFGGDGFTPNVIILGNTTASYNGTVTLTGIQLKTNSAACLTISGSNTSTLYLNACNIDANNATGISCNNANFGIFIANCYLQSESNNLLFAVTNISGLSIRDSKIASGTGASTVAAGGVSIQNCRCESFSITTSSTGSVVVYNSNLDNSSLNQTVFTTGGIGGITIGNSSLSSGTASTISVGSGTVCTISNCNLGSSNTNCITGLGTLQYGNLVFTSSSSTINTTTRNALIISPRGESWTPTVIGSTSAGTVTYTVQLGTYMRIGSLVFISWSLAWTTGTGTGNLQIGGLPINIINTANLRSVGAVLIGNSLTPPATSVTSWAAAAGDVTTTGLLIQAADATGNTVNYAYSAQGRCNGSIWYWVA